MDQALWLTQPKENHLPGPVLYTFSSRRTQVQLHFWFYFPMGKSDIIEFLTIKRWNPGVLAENPEIWRWRFTSGNHRFHRIFSLLARYVQYSTYFTGYKRHKSFRKALLSAFVSATSTSREEPCKRALPTIYDGGVACKIVYSTHFKLCKI